MEVKVWIFLCCFTNILISAIGLIDKIHCLVLNNKHGILISLTKTFHIHWLKHEKLKIFLLYNGRGIKHVSTLYLKHQLSFIKVTTVACPK